MFNYVIGPHGIAVDLMQGKELKQIINISDNIVIGFGFQSTAQNFGVRAAYVVYVIVDHDADVGLLC